MWPNPFAFRLITVCWVLFSSLTPCNTSSFLTRSVQLISILLQHHISALSSISDLLSEVSKFQHHTKPRFKCSTAQFQHHTKLYSKCSTAQFQHHTKLHSKCSTAQFQHHTKLHSKCSIAQFQHHTTLYSKCSTALVFYLNLLNPFDICLTMHHWYKWYKHQLDATITVY